MKKLFILIVACISAFTFVLAGNYVIKSAENEVEVAQNEPIITYETIYINSSSITVPYTITVPAPPLGTIINVAGPCNENMTDWSVHNGNLSINYTTPCDIYCLKDPGEHFIETPTMYEGTLKKYKIKIIVQ